MAIIEHGNEVIPWHYSTWLFQKGVRDTKFQPTLYLRLFSIPVSTLKHTQPQSSKLNLLNWRRLASIHRRLEAIGVRKWSTPGQSLAALISDTLSIIIYWQGRVPLIRGNNWNNDDKAPSDWNSNFCPL